MELTTTDKAIELLGYLSIVAIWLLTILNYTNLPEIIPLHYNAEGVADGFGRKRTIFTLPIIATVIFFGLTILNMVPHSLNYPTEINEESALKQYSNFTRMNRYLKLILVVIFGHILIQTIRHTHGKTDGLGSWSTHIEIGLIFLPIVYYFIKSMSSKN